MPAVHLSWRQISAGLLTTGRIAGCAITTIPLAADPTEEFSVAPEAKVPEFIPVEYRLRWAA